MTRGGVSAAYHLGLLLLQGEEAFPPAQDAALGLHQVAADLVEALLLLGGPVEGEEDERSGGG